MRRPFVVDSKMAHGVPKLSECILATERGHYVETPGIRYMLPQARTGRQEAHCNDVTTCLSRDRDDN
jgi:hypothetical protein